MKLWNSKKGSLAGAGRNQQHPRIPSGVSDRLSPMVPGNSGAGSALIVLLTCLVFIAALAIGLLNRVESDRSSSAAYRGGVNRRNLAEYAVNLVMSQIATATMGTNAGNAWASQPGAIRTYSSNSSALLNIYKLYSSFSMIGDTGIVAGDASDLANWTSNTALYTDLNAPVVAASGITNYPILDPGATSSVQGFTIDSNAPLAIGGAINAAPMPVTWLYVLQDGTLVAPVATTNVSGNSVTVPGATAANPITGRIAFWTDDETCKININTAAGAPWNYTNTTFVQTFNGTFTNTMPANYWDTPILGSSQDHNLAISQPWASEFQRFPGHPATVSISAVFTNLDTNGIMTIAPRISYLSNSTAVGSQWGSFITVSTASPIPGNGARLYPDPDELLYATNRSATGTNPLTLAQINQGRFFLTASSRAPDVTMFNTPRIQMWPINANTNQRTPYDNLIASMIGTLPTGSGTPYYFVRSNAYSTTSDYMQNTALLGYLRTMTTLAVPAFGGSRGILGKYNTLIPGYSSANESEQILTEIFDYIRSINLQDNSVTTNGSYYYSPSAYVVPSIPTSGSGAGTRGFGRIPIVSKAGLLFSYNTNSSTPNNYLSSNDETGLQTNASTNVSMVCRLVLETFTPAEGYPMLLETNLAGLVPYSNVVTGLTNGFKWGAATNSTTSIFPTSSATYCEFNNANQKITMIGGRHGIQNFYDASGLPSNAFGTNSPWFEAQTYSFSGGYLTNTSTHWGTNLGTNIVTTGSGCFTWPGGSTNASTNVLYVQSTNTVTNPGTFYFIGGQSGGSNPLTITSYYNGTQIQVINNINFPDIPNALPLPTINTNSPILNGPNSWATNARPQWTLYSSNVITTNDVVRSVQMASGDFRIEGAGASVDGSARFITHPNYYSSAISNSYRAHTFVGQDDSALVGATMISNGYYSSTSTGMTNIAASSSQNIMSGWPNGEMITNSLSSSSLGLGGALTSLTKYGDFDNGYGYHADGPYIGFADGGVSTTNVSPGSIPYFSIQTNSSTFLSGYFSPNRLVPSAGVLGSLPTGAMTKIPWQTLLFRPAALTAASHPGLTAPPDFLLLDLLNMPVVQPYAISEPLSTAGRINMNYQILPFTWIHRPTAIMAALHTERITAIPNTMTIVGAGGSITDRKHWNAAITATNRFPINLATNGGTLQGFENRFGSNDIFRSAAEICAIPLVPANAPFSPSYTTMSNWWTNFTYTGENTKERPYARIYPKLTTKSNTYTVHYRVEVLKKRPSGTQTTWIDGSDKVLSTYRGSTTIERFVNPADSSIINYTTATLPLSLTNALPYKFRTIGQRQFCP